METIVGVLQEVKGHTFDIIYDLYFTDERLIAVLIQHPSESINNQSSFSWQNLLLGNTFSKRKEQDELNRLADELRSKNKAMTPSELATCRRGNYEIRYKSIANLEIKTSILGTNMKITHTNPANKTLSFGLTKKQAKEILPLLEKYLPSKLKGK